METAKRDVPATLRDLTYELDLLGEDIESNGGEVPPGSDLEARWNELCGALVAKVDSFAEYAQVLESEADRLDAASKALKAKSQARKNHRERMLAYAGYCLGARSELKGELWALKVRKNPPSVRVTDEDAVAETCPTCLVRTPLADRHEVIDGKVYLVKIDKAALKDDMRSGRGEHIRGAEIVQSSRVVIA